MVPSLRNNNRGVTRSGLNYQKGLRRVAFPMSEVSCDPKDQLSQKNHSSNGVARIDEMEDHLRVMHFQAISLSLVDVRVEREPLYSLIFQAWYGS